MTSQSHNAALQKTEKANRVKRPIAEAEENTVVALEGTVVVLPVLLPTQNQPCVLKPSHQSGRIRHVRVLVEFLSERLADCEDGPEGLPERRAPQQKKGEGNDGTCCIADFESIVLKVSVRNCPGRLVVSLEPLNHPPKHGCRPIPVVISNPVEETAEKITENQSTQKTQSYIQSSS